MPSFLDGLFRAFSSKSSASVDDISLPPSRRREDSLSDPLDRHPSNLNNQSAGMNDPLSQLQKELQIGTEGRKLLRYEDGAVKIDVSLLDDNLRGEKKKKKQKKSGSDSVHTTEVEDLISTKKLPAPMGSVDYAWHDKHHGKGAAGWVWRTTSKAGEPIVVKRPYYSFLGDKKANKVDKSDVKWSTGIHDDALKGLAVKHLLPGVGDHIVDTIASGYVERRQEYFYLSISQKDAIFDRHTTTKAQRDGWDDVTKARKYKEADQKRDQGYDKAKVKVKLSKPEPMIVQAPLEETLEKRLKIDKETGAGKPLPLQETLRHSKVLLRVLAAFEKLGLSHGDLHMKNLMFDYSNELVVIDLGEVGSKGGGITPGGGGGIQVPEGHDQTRVQRDAWAVGVNILGMMKGHDSKSVIPNADKATQEVVDKVIDDTIKGMAKRPDVVGENQAVADLKDVVRGLLRVDPSERWSTSRAQKRLTELREVSTI
jgi:Phosphotransferase enzyme family